METPQQPEWIIRMKGKLKEAKEYAADQPWQKWSIYRLPNRLQDAHDTKLYSPQTVSIGPYHHADQVRVMERHKWISLNNTLECTGHDLSLYVNAIKEVEKQARECYQHDTGYLISDQFVKMMVLDACFVLKLFRCSPKVVKHPDIKVPVVFDSRMIDDILLDMIMLENHIPLFVLDTLLGLDRVGGGEEPEEHAVGLALNMFNSEWLTALQKEFHEIAFSTGAPLSVDELRELKVSLESAECLHVLDVFRRSLLHQEPQQNPSCKTPQRHKEVIHTVTELRAAGIKFRKRNTNLVWDIKFNDGILEIPSIWIQDGTVSILLNLAVFEHCHLKIRDAVIASYAVFMECLIKSAEDVSYLHKHGIIQHLLGHVDEAVDVFKCVSKEMLVDANGGCYAGLTEEVNAYCNRRRNRWRASFLRIYFSTPWTIISLIAAVFLLVLTALQTFYKVYPYYKQ